MDRNELREILIDEFDMQIAHIDKSIEQIESFDEEIKNACFTFIKTKSSPDLKAGAYSYKLLVDEHGFSPIGAFILLDWLKKDVKEAEMFLMFM